MVLELSFTVLIAQWKDTCLTLRQSRSGQAGTKPALVNPAGFVRNLSYVFAPWFPAFTAPAAGSWNNPTISTWARFIRLGSTFLQKWQSCSGIWTRPGNSKVAVTQCSTKPPFLSPPLVWLNFLCICIKDWSAEAELCVGSMTRTERMVEVKGAQWNWNGQRRQWQNLLQIWMSCIQRIQPSAGLENSKCSLQTEFRLSWHAENSVKLESNPGYHSSLKFIHLLSVLQSLGGMVMDSRERCGKISFSLCSLCLCHALSQTHSLS